MIQVIKCRDGKCYEKLIEENFEVIGYDLDGNMVLDNDFEEE